MLAKVPLPVLSSRLWKYPGTSRSASEIRTLASTENPLCCQMSMSAAASRLRKPFRRNHRTSLAMISLGFGIERLGQAAVGFDGPLVGFSPFKMRIFGAALILLGIAATLAGMWEHRHMLKAIKDDDYRYADRPPIARSMGFSLVVVGLSALAVIFVF